MVKWVGDPNPTEKPYRVVKDVPKVLQAYCKKAGLQLPKCCKQAEGGSKRKMTDSTGHEFEACKAAPKRRREMQQNHVFNRASSVMLSLGLGNPLLSSSILIAAIASAPGDLSAVSFWFVPVTLLLACFNSPVAASYTSARGNQAA